MSVTQLQEIPPRNMILLVGPPGSGKSTFCYQSVLHNLAMDRPIIYITTFGKFGKRVEFDGRVLSLPF